MISFEVEDYPGPDRDPILMGDTLVSRMTRKTVKDQASRLQEDFDMSWAVPSKGAQLRGVNSQAENGAPKVAFVKEVDEEGKRSQIADYKADDDDISMEGTNCSNLQNYRMHVKENS